MSVFQEAVNINIDESVQIIMTDLANDVSASGVTFSVASDRAIAPTMALPKPRPWLSHLNNVKQKEHET